MAREISVKMLHFRKSWIALSLATLMHGCASMNQPADFREEELKLNQYAALTSMAAVQKLEQDIRSPENKELNVYAPQHFSTAEKALADAKTLLNQNGPKDEIVQKVAVGEAVLKNADRFMRKVKDTLSNELTLKQQLEALNTNHTYAGEYGSLVDRLNKIIQGFESGNTDATENREKLLKDMQQLEQKARRHNAMHEPEEIIKRVKNNGGDTLAPQTYREALEVFVRAEKFILLNPGYSAGIEQVGREALFAAKRAWYITQEVAALSQKFNLSPEQIVLDEEYRMHRVARELGDNDFRDHPLEVQSEMLAKIATERFNELKNKDDLVIALRDTLVKVTDTSSHLTELSDVTQQLKQEKGGWLAKEALYKAKLEELSEQLAQSQAQLDKTQQTVLSIQNENLKLTQSLRSTLSTQNSANIPTSTAQQNLPVDTPAFNPTNPPESETATADIKAFTLDTPANTELPATSDSVMSTDATDSTAVAETSTPEQSLTSTSSTPVEVVKATTDSETIQSSDNATKTHVVEENEATIPAEQSIQITTSTESPPIDTLPNTPPSPAVATSSEESDGEGEQTIKDAFVDANQ